MQAFLQEKLQNLGEVLDEDSVILHVQPQMEGRNLFVIPFRGSHSVVFLCQQKDVVTLLEGLPGEFEGVEVEAVVLLEEMPVFGVEFDFEVQNSDFFPVVFGEEPLIREEIPFFFFEYYLHPLLLLLQTLFSLVDGSYQTVERGHDQSSILNEGGFERT